jgi:hypothetical protein
VKDILARVFQCCILAFQIHAYLFGSLEDLYLGIFIGLVNSKGIKLTDETASSWPTTVCKCQDISGSSFE